MLGSKLLFWVKPDAKIFIKGIIFTAVFILLVIYLHSEYLTWVSLSENKTYLNISYFVKNLLILISLFILFLYLKKQKKITYAKVKGEEKIYTKNAKEDYFDKFRNKEKLRTKGEQILRKNDKDD